MIEIRSCCLLAGFIAASLSATVAVAQPAARFGGDAYGRGVQAYFSGNFAEAEPLLMEATSRDPKDPRPHYFHGLCLLRQGQVEQARSDFMIAAALEARSRRSYPVGKSLERVQGGDRLMLEQYRWRAQPAAATPTSVAPIVSRRYGATIAIPSDAGVLRQAASVPLDELANPVNLADLKSLAETAPAPTTPSVTNEPSPTTARDTVRGTDTPPNAAAAENPFVDDQHAPQGGKIPSGKLLGIVGRAIIEAAPVPSVDSLRDQLSSVPLPAGGGPSAPADAETDFDETFAPAAEDPFFESTPTADDSELGDPAPTAEEEDPFGEF